MNLTPKECAIGIRVNKILEKIDITNDKGNGEKIEIFLKEVSDNN